MDAFASLASLTCDTVLPWLVAEDELLESILNRLQRFTAINSCCGFGREGPVGLLPTCTSLYLCTARANSCTFARLPALRQPHSITALLPQTHSSSSIINLSRAEISPLAPICFKRSASNGVVPVASSSLPLRDRRVISVLHTSHPRPCLLPVTPDASVFSLPCGIWQAPR